MMVKFHGLQSKLRPTDRYRGGVQWVERKSNAWAAFIGFMLGRGHSSVSIAEQLADGTHPATIRRMAALWDIQTGGEGRVSITINLTTKQRALLQARADQRGVGLAEYIKRFVLCGSQKFGTYDEIVPEDQFQ